MHVKVQQGFRFLKGAGAEGQCISSHKSQLEKNGPFIRTPGARQTFRKCTLGS